MKTTYRKVLSAMNREEQGIDGAYICAEIHRAKNSSYGSHVHSVKNVVIDRDIQDVVVVSGGEHIGRGRLILIFILGATNDGSSSFSQEGLEQIGKVCYVEIGAHVRCKNISIIDYAAENLTLYSSS